MTLATVFPWRHQFGEKPYPDPLPLLGGQWQVVVLSTRVGFWALEKMIAEGGTVGPVLNCVHSGRLYVPIASRSRGCPLAARFEIALSLDCHHTYRQTNSPCRSRVWMLPPDETTRELTDFSRLHDAVNRIRSERSERSQAT